MNTTNRALRFVNVLPLPAGARAERKPALTSGRDVAGHEGTLRANAGDQSVMASRRGEALRSFFPKVFTWFASRWDLDGMSEVNHYLSQASDSADLERRIRQLEQRRHFRG